MGPIQGAHGTQKPPSGDPDTCIASHPVANQSQDARSGLQSMSGVAVGNEGRGVDTSSSICNVPNIGAQVTDILQVPSTAFNPQLPLETFQSTQPVDMLGITNAQPAALDAAAAFTQLVTAAAAT